MSENKNIEIERKFLVNFTETGNALTEKLEKMASKKFLIKQGYLLRAADKTIRVRTKGDKGYLTIKGKANENGFARFEWEREISLEDAEQIMELCERFIIEKTRYEVVYEGKVFEIDQFHGLNDGLVIAELELEAENESYKAPEWLGKEVTGDIRYYNSWLSQNPYVG
ncbi:MAG TPA: CYTH domain-containing protein [Bacteroidales bacterium]|nr:CYTH domain-containing protein [Bacteroidales bacterium]